jgi:hypothetical protein
MLCSIVLVAKIEINPYICTLIKEIKEWQKINQLSFAPIAAMTRQNGWANALHADNGTLFRRW